MSLGDRFRRLARSVSDPHPDGIAELQVGDPRFDEWEIVRDFGELESARAWRQTLTEAGIDSALTADWPLDKWGRGDIALRVPPEQWPEANELLDEPP